MSAGLTAGAAVLYIKLPSLISNAVTNLTADVIPEVPAMKDSPFSAEPSDRNILKF